MRYIPTTPEERERMLQAIGVRSVDDLFADVPERVRLRRPLRLRPALSDPEVLRYLAELAVRETQVHNPLNDSSLHWRVMAQVSAPRSVRNACNARSSRSVQRPSS